MMMSNDADLLEYLPDLYDYGIQDFSSYHAKTEQDILRELRIRWWPTVSYRAVHDIRIVSSPEMNPLLLEDTQFTRSAVFHCLSFYVLPQLNKFEPDGDRFGEMMTYYRDRYKEEFDLVLRDGVLYDFDGDSTITSAEREPQYFLRLQR